MIELEFTRHGQKRIRQRGRREFDISLIVEYGTETSEGYYLLDKDVTEIEREAKFLLKQLHRLKGSLAVVDGKEVITTFKPNEKQRKKLLENFHPH